MADIVPAVKTSASASAHTPSPGGTASALRTVPAAVPPAFAGTAAFASAPMPLSELNATVEKYLCQLEDRIARHTEEARRDLFAFCFLKICVFAGTLGTGVLEAYGKGSWVPALGLVATLFATFDAIRPKGNLYRTHRLAESELTLLLSHSRAEWDIAKLRYGSSGGAPLQTAAIGILERIVAKLNAVERGVTSAETVLEEPKSATTATAEPSQPPKS